jgi:hypothetical protein
MQTTISEVVAAISAAHIVAMFIVNLTPTPKDNEALGNVNTFVVKLYKAIELLAGVITPLVKK